VALPTSNEVPVLGRLKDGLTPLLEWAPPWVRDAIWALSVYIVLVTFLSLLVRRVVPWVGQVLPGPVEGLLNLTGMLLVLPEFVATTLICRASRRVPNALFGYGEAVQVVVTGSQRVSRSSLTAMNNLKQTSPKLLAMLVLVVFAGWNSFYCGDRGESCRTPTSVWADSVSAWFDAQGDD